MANKTPRYDAVPLDPTDRVLYVEVASGVYALAMASVLMTGNAELLTVDDTGALVTIPYAHHQIHEGRTFTASIFSIVNADGTDITMLLRTGSVYYGHLTFTTAAGGDAQVRLLESPTMTNDGNGLTERNMKRYSAVPSPGTTTPVAEIQAFGNPTYVEQTILTNFLLAGGAARQSGEWVLRRSTDYIIELTNIAGNNQPLSITAQWTEESTA